MTVQPDRGGRRVRWTQRRGGARGAPCKQRGAAHATNSRRGTAVVEFAVIAPLFFLLLFGIIEFGRALTVQQILTNASREGSRRAIVEDATVTEVQQVVDDYLSGASISGTTVNVSPSSLDSVGLGDPVRVTLSVPFSSVSWVPGWFLGDRTLTASTTMRGERLQ